MTSHKSIGGIGSIGIVPYDLRSQRNLGAMSLAALSWPGQVQPQGQTIDDLGECDCIVVYPSSTRMFTSLGQLRCKVALLLTEPKAVHQKYYRLIWLIRFKFDVILCRYPEVCRRYPNAIHFQPAEYWVQPEQAIGPVDKALQCSLIASNKTNLPGHKLRHLIVDWVRGTDVSCDVLGRGYLPFAEKADGLLPYRYTVVIENIEESHYFSEKLLDAFLCETIPIYWGASNISDYFDPLGMVLCDNLRDIQAAMLNMTSQSSDGMRAAMRANKLKALTYAHLEHRLVTVIRGASV